MKRSVFQLDRNDRDDGIKTKHASFILTFFLQLYVEISRTREHKTVSHAFE